MRCGCGVLSRNEIILSVSTDSSDRGFYFWVEPAHVRDSDVMIICLRIHVRDGEKAIVEVNGKACFSKNLFSDQGKHVCGQSHSGWRKDDRLKVTCTVAAMNGTFTVRVYTNLDSAGDDESFGIDNVVFKNVGDDSRGAPSGSMTSNFDDGDFQGWSCNKITTCGSFGKICGGFNTKAKSDEIKKTFNVSPGMYSVSLDFIRIDSWLVCCSMVLCGLVVRDHLVSSVCSDDVMQLGIESLMKILRDHDVPAHVREAEKAIVEVNGKTCFTETLHNGQYMDKSVVRADGTLPSAWKWERFKVVHVGNNNIALYNPTHKRFMRMPSMEVDTKMTKSAVRANGTLPSAWKSELFKVVDAQREPRGRFHLHD